MKIFAALLFILSLITSASSNAQVGKFLKNVKNSVADDLLGKSNNNNKNMPEPPSACEPADQVIGLGKYQMQYNEINIDALADGRIILQDKMNGKYYIVKDGVTEGPIKDSDPRVKQFEQIVEKDDAEAAMLALYKDYISKQGDKYLITFAGKSYGPYGKIDQFLITRSKDKFAATVVENIVVTDDEGKQMDEAIKNAKNDQERMQLAMQYGQKIQDKMMAGGGPSTMTPKLISNIPVSNSDEMATTFNFLNATMKYDDILLTNESRITDLQGKTIFNLQMGQYDPANTFISSDNKRYATYSYGTLTISDGKKLSELFNPFLVKAEGKVYLAYMYYSPKRDAIMQCKIAF